MLPVFSYILQTEVSLTVAQKGVWKDQVFQVRFSTTPFSLMLQGSHIFKHAFPDTLQSLCFPAQSLQDNPSSRC